MIPTGKPWGPDEENQKEIMIQYEYDENLTDSLEKYNLNPEFDGRTNMEVTGIVEDSVRIWMHPFRQNQYNFMEVAPFPEVLIPIKVGEKWGRVLNIGSWGVWSDHSVAFEYEVIGYEQIQIGYGSIEAWRISSYSIADFGNSTHNFWFHPKLGFVKMVVHNYAGQTLEIALAETIDP